MIKIKSKSQTGWLPKNESIKSTWEELDLNEYGNVGFKPLALKKENAMYLGDCNDDGTLKEHKVRKVKVTLTLTIEDIE